MPLHFPAKQMAGIPLSSVAGWVEITNRLAVKSDVSAKAVAIQNLGQFAMCGAVSNLTSTCNCDEQTNNIWIYRSAFADNNYDDEHLSVSRWDPQGSSLQGIPS